MSRARRRRCPQCNAPFTSAGVSDNPAYPFCSERCKLIDLGRWLQNDYAIVEDLTRGRDLINDPDVKAALEDLEHEG